MEWQQVIGFYQIAKLGSFTKAAEATFRTQSALSQQIKAYFRWREISQICRVYSGELR